MNPNLPPVAKDTICVDFDGTLFQWGDLYSKTPPLQGAIEFMRELRKKGWYIVIFTSRMSPTWWESEGWDFRQAMSDQTTFIEYRLNEYGIPFDRITAEKVPAEYYIDDKALKYEGATHSWNEIRKLILK